MLAQSVLRASFDQQRDEIADRTVLEFRLRLVDRSRYLGGGDLGEPLGQPVNDLADRSGFI
ncbi:MAG TPA: hypothetical protein VFB74_35805 [Kribbellaceae bacterium]|nr:hypothetical protein [Kribbellaceae bacterium]